MSLLMVPLLYLFLCFIVKRLRIASNDMAICLCHVTGVHYKNLLRKSDELDRIKFYYLW